MSFLISNFSDTLVLASWTTLAAFQTTTAIIDAWKLWKNFRRPATEYERVINGETRRGWHVAIPWNDLLKYHFPSTPESKTGFYYDFLLWTDDLDNQSDLMTPPSTSFVFLFEHLLPNGNFVYRIRRHSFIQPNASGTLLKISCDPKKWAMEHCRYLTSRNLMVSFRRTNGSQFRIFLLDAFRKGRQTLTVVPPEENIRLTFAYLETNPSNRQLHLVWNKFVFSGIENRLEFIHSVYSLPSGNWNSMLNSLSFESISFPIGNHNHYKPCLNSGVPVIAISCNVSHQDHALCFTFDHQKKWKRETFAQWLAELEKSDMGTRICKAAQSYLQLSLPINWKWPKIDAMKRFHLVFTVPRSDALFAATRRGGILKRWIRPPTLLRTAAEHLFKAYPELKLSQLKKATGIDLSDGIPDEDKEDCETVTL